MRRVGRVRDLDPVAGVADHGDVVTLVRAVRVAVGVRPFALDVDPGSVVVHDGCDQIGPELGRGLGDGVVLVDIMWCVDGSAESLVEACGELVDRKGAIRCGIHQCVERIHAQVVTHRGCQVVSSRRSAVVVVGLRVVVAG